jgi:hypothetical protein
VASSCEFGIEPSSSMKCWETIEWPNISSCAQLHRVSVYWEGRGVEGHIRVYEQVYTVYRLLMRERKV